MCFSRCFFKCVKMWVRILRLFGVKYWIGAGIMTESATGAQLKVFKRPGLCVCPYNEENRFNVAFFCQSWIKVVEAALCSCWLHVVVHRCSAAAVSLWIIEARQGSVWPRSFYSSLPPSSFHFLGKWESRNEPTQAWKKRSALSNEILIPERGSDGKHTPRGPQRFSIRQSACRTRRRDRREIWRSYGY